MPRENLAQLLTFFDFPAEHWEHLRTKALTMAFKLLEMPQLCWRRLNGAKQLPLVRAGVVFVDGLQIEREDAATAA